MSGIHTRRSFAANTLPIAQAQQHTPPPRLALRKWLGWVGFWAVLMLAAGFPVLAQEATEDNPSDQDANADSGYRYLLREVSTVVNSKGLKTTRIHNRVEIQQQHAVDEIGDVSIPYNAFRSEARLVKAFTQTADGRTVALKKESVRDLMPEEVSSCQMYTDVHQFSFSMPALSKGAVMDYEVEIEEKKPVMAGNFWVSEFLDSGVQVCTSRVTVVFPAKREVRLVTTHLPTGALVTDVTRGNQRTLTWEMKNLSAVRYEPGMPPDSSVRAQIQLTSVKSWQQVEEWYAGLAKKHLQPDAEIQAQARKLVSGLTNPVDQIQALYRYASRDVRYVGVELGRSDYEPHAPRETMQNKYGDCKDKAALLVSLLKAIGIPAHMAIVRPNYQGPVEQSLPGPAQFSHAIVYVPREGGDLWIDATEPFGEVTEHGFHLDDIDAMVVGLAGKTFVHVPLLDETHSVHRLIFDLDVHYGGLCTVHETQEFSGRAAIAEREQRSRLEVDKVRKQLEHNLGAGSGYGRLLDYSVTPPTKDCGPVQVVLDYESDTFLSPTKSGFSVRFDAAELRHRLEVPRPDTTSVRRHKRVYPWVARRAQTEEIICRLHLPPGYELAHTPSETHNQLPHGLAELLFDNTKVPCLTLRVISRPARLAPDQLTDVAQQVDHALSRVRTSLDIEDSVNDLIREHRFAKAEAAILEGVRRATNSADALLRLGLYYKTVGRVYQSRLAFEQAIGLAPQNPRGYEMLAETYSGWWGIPGEGFDRKSMMAVYDRALTNVPVRAWTLQRKAGVCLMSDLGRSECTNHLDEAEGYFRTLLKEDAQSYKGLFGLGQVNRLRGNYDTAEDYYRRAARVKGDKVEPRAGIWLSLAYAGRAEEAWNAISAYYGGGEQMNTEVIRVASLLTLSRHYEEAARLYDRLVESAARPEVIQKLSRLLRKAEKVKHNNYEHFYDDSSPESLAQTLVIASFMGDTGRVFRCLSPVVNRDQVRHVLQRQASLLNNISTKMDPSYLADITLSAFEVTKRTLDNGDVEVKLDGTKSTGTALNSLSSVVTLLVQPVSNRWQALTMDEPDLDWATLGRLALEALEHGDRAQALAWQTRLADVASRPRAGRSRTTLTLSEHLQEIAFTNDVLRVKAWAGMGLAGSTERADMTRGAACLEEVVSAYPDDPQLKMALAYVEAQLANLHKAGTLLDTINIAKLAAPEQLVALAQMQFSLEKLDAAEAVIARLKEVAPDHEQLLLLQAYALTYRAKYAQAETTLARLRERSQLQGRVAIGEECQALCLGANPATLRDFVEYWREPEKPVATQRAVMSCTCLALGLLDEASEQIATMLAEGSLTTDALISYAEIALTRGNTAEARHLVSVADRLSQHTAGTEHLHNLALVHLALGDYPEAASIYRDHGTRIPFHYSGYSLCMSALASRLAGDTTAAAEALKLAATMQGDSDWPRLAVQYLSGSISEEEFRHAPERTTTTPLMRASRECEVNCMIALLKESKHDLPGALAAYQACVATKSASDLEYTIARLALLRLHDAHSGTAEDNRAGNHSASRPL